MRKVNKYLLDRETTSRGIALSSSSFTISSKGSRKLQPGQTTVEESNSDTHTHTLCSSQVSYRKKYLPIILLFVYFYGHWDPGWCQGETEPRSPGHLPVGERRQWKQKRKKKRILKRKHQGSVSRPSFDSETTDLLGKIAVSVCLPGVNDGSPGQKRTPFLVPKLECRWKILDLSMVFFPLSPNRRKDLCDVLQFTTR